MSALPPQSRHSTAVAAYPLWAIFDQLRNLCPANVIQAVMAQGRRKEFVVVLAVSLLAAESSLQASAQTADLVRVLVLNSQWNSAYTRAACKSADIWYKTVGKEIEPLGCENFPACPDLMATAKACRSANAAAALRDFEQTIIGSLASDAACAHVTVVRYTGVGDAVYDNLAKLHDSEDFWNLSVNFHPGLTKQPWQVKHRAATMSGDDDAQTIAGQTCSLILGKDEKAN